MGFPVLLAFVSFYVSTNSGNLSLLLFETFFLLFHSLFLPWYFNYMYKRNFAIILQVSQSLFFSSLYLIFRLAVSIDPTSHLIDIFFCHFILLLSLSSISFISIESTKCTLFYFLFLFKDFTYFLNECIVLSIIYLVFTLLSIIIIITLRFFLIISNYGSSQDFLHWLSFFLRIGHILLALGILVTFKFIPPGLCVDFLYSLNP